MNEEIMALDKKCKKLFYTVLICIVLTLVASVLGFIEPMITQAAIIPLVVGGIAGGLLILNGNLRKILMTGKRGVSGYAILGIIFGGVVIPLLTSMIAQKLGKAN